MSSFTPRTIAPNFDESRWIIQIRRTLDEELEELIEVPVCIFNVPKSLMVTDPDSYVPQQVALGPYHYWRPELYEMERYKLAAAKRTQKQLQNIKFQHLVEQLIKLESRIRSCYHKYLNFNGETLAWMMAVDASFLLEFLQIYAVKEGSDECLLLTIPEGQCDRNIEYFGESGGHLHLIDLNPHTCTKFDIWEMEVNYSGWFVKYHVDLDFLPNLYPNMVNPPEDYAYSNVFSTICFLEDEKDEAMLVLALPGKIILYKLGKNGMIKELADVKPASLRHFLDGARYNGFDMYKYVETLACV